MKKIMAPHALVPARVTVLAPAMGSRARRLATVAAALSAFVLPLVNAAPAQAVTREVHLSYISKDGLGNTKYDVRFNGTVRANGPTGYIVDGELDAYCASGTATTQYAALDYHGAGDAWGHKPRACDDLPEHFHFTGTRKKGAKIELVVGATSKVGNLYGWGNTVSYDIGTK